MHTHTHISIKFSNFYEVYHTCSIMLMPGTTDYLVKTLNCQAEKTSLWVLVQGESKKPPNTLGFLSELETKPYCWRHCTLLVTVLKETILSLTQKFLPREPSFIVSKGSIHSTKGEKKLQQWWDWQAVPNSTIIVFASCRQPIVVKLNLKPDIVSPVKNS